MSTTRSPHLVTTAAPAAPAAVVHRDRLLVRVVAAVTAVSLAGALLAVATGLSAGWADAVGPTARLSVPLPMNLALCQVALVLGLTALGVLAGRRAVLLRRG